VLGLPRVRPWRSRRLSAVRGALRPPRPTRPLLIALRGALRPPRPTRPLLIALLCAASLVTLACGDDDDGSSPNGTGGEAAQTPPEPAPEEPQQTESSQAGGCRDVQQPEPRAEGGAKKSARRLDPGTTYVVTLTTSCGDIGIRLDQKTSPMTAASFANLARTGFYDGTVFHRIVPGFVIQGGDPTGSGSGGPGYTTRDVPPRDASYRSGTVAMAKSPAEPPGTAGSQFFIVTGPDAGLPPDYALLGSVVKGQRVVDEIGQLGDPASGGAGTPLQIVVIEGAKVSER
jgi:peptidyl-prolyl cis-trans isomerase B (cyclophilin B)